MDKSVTMGYKMVVFNRFHALVLAIEKSSKQVGHFFFRIEVSCSIVKKKIIFPMIAQPMGFKKPFIMVRGK